MIQKEIVLSAYSRGFHNIDHEIESYIEDLPETGMLNIFIKHTSAGILINEGADPSVLTDFNSYFDRLVKENEPYFTHIYEGPDDMPAHIKSALTQTSINIPITNGKLNLGTWQSLYLCEFRNDGGRRKLVLTIW
ncbi:MAG: secondary thiamine-phosphate synthase enzyme YjbQ [Crocinitomicaceae bacterium]|nr:secondary thiamine-phosphate synthase enzyme YjbQ [Crocinitomicaceae bacterium]